MNKLEQSYEETLRRNVIYHFESKLKTALQGEHGGIIRQLFYVALTVSNCTVLQVLDQLLSMYRKE